MRASRSPNIARELDVQAVVEGSVLRVGDQVRITAQLIRVPADEHLWAHGYDGSFRDALALQSEVSRAIAGQIIATLSRQEQAAFTQARMVNPDAYEAYLKGRYFWNKRDASALEKAIDYFHGVLSPQEAFPRAKEAATQALRLNPMLVDAHTSLAWVLTQYVWDWDGAEKEFRRALELDPGYATAHHWYAYYLITIGRTDAAISE